MEEPDKKSERKQFNKRIELTEEVEQVVRDFLLSKLSFTAAAKKLNITKITMAFAVVGIVRGWVQQGKIHIS